MSDTPEIKGKPKKPINEEAIPEISENSQAENLQEQSASLPGIGQIDAKAMKSHFAQGIYMELLRARADHGFFNANSLPSANARETIAKELVHLRSMAEAAAEVWFKNK